VSSAGFVNGIWGTKQKETKGTKRRIANLGFEISKGFKRVLFFSSARWPFGSIGCCVRAAEKQKSVWAGACYKQATPNGVVRPECGM